MNNVSKFNYGLFIDILNAIGVEKEAKLLEAAIAAGNIERLPDGMYQVIGRHKKAS